MRRPPDLYTRERPGSTARALSKSIVADGDVGKAEDNRWACTCDRCNPRRFAALYWPQPARTCRRWGAFDLVRPIDVIVHYGPLSWTESELLDELAVAS